MSRIAQKLCDEVVEPPLKSLKYGDFPISSPSKCVSQVTNKNSPRPKKATPSILVDKKRQIYKIPSKDFSNSRTEFVNEQTLLNKSYANRAVNTHITGALRCDNDCVTVVRKRDNKCSCKCGNKALNFKSSVKQVQTLGKPIFFDKACTQCVETLSCGTQFLEKQESEAKSHCKIKSGIMKPTRDIRHIFSNQADLRNSDLRQTYWKGSNLTDSDLLKPDLRNSSLRSSGLRTTNLRNSDIRQTDLGHAHINDFDRSTIYNYMGARRWALSQYYPSKGPDF